jgi:hypothetical protein
MVTLQPSRFPFPPLHPEFSWRVERVGHEHIPLLIIDHFLQGAESLVEHAAQRRDFNRDDTRYPGIRAKVPPLYIQAFQYHLHDLVASVFGLKDEWVTGVRSELSIVTNKPDELVLAQKLPHYDSLNARELAAVHYLCDASHGGTSLYRHERSGLLAITPDTIEHYRTAQQQDRQTGIEPTGYMNGSNDWYEQVASVDAAFNRLVIYPCNVLHSGNISPAFEGHSNPTQGRLTLNTFIFCN